VGKRSRLEIHVGQELKDEYGLGYHERLCLEVRGNPKWDGKQGRLELEYDEVSDTFRAFQPVTVPDSRLDSRKLEEFPEVENGSRFRNSPLASHEAALDVGANNLVACSTTTGSQYLYDDRELFGRFRETTDEIARLQSKLPERLSLSESRKTKSSGRLREGRYSSKRIRRLYRQRTKRRDHAQNALVRDLVERLYDEGVATVYVGDLTDVLETHWSVRVNEKTHNFWAFKKFIHRLSCVCEVYGISLEAESEAWTSQTCPECGDHEETVRHGDTLTCPCGFEGHADLTASETFLRKTAIRKSGRWHGPCDSSGTTTTGRGNHTPTKVPKKCAQTRKLPPWIGSRTPTEESSRFSAGRMSSTANSSQSVEMTHALAPSSAFSDETAYSMFEKWVRIFSAATES